MKERPILFSGPMIRALLAGTKTQTRRAVKPQAAILTDEMARALGVRPPAQRNAPVIQCPHGQPGDRLWVRETYAPYDGQAMAERDTTMLFYRADDETKHDTDGRWRPSVHMPRWASRILLEVTGVRVERLQDISEADAQAEGWTRRPEVSTDPQVHSDAARDWFMDLWESINGPDSWAANPWVWVVEFRRIRP